MNSGYNRGHAGRHSRPLALLALLAACAPLHAQETDPVYTMTVIADAAHGSKIVAGKYRRAIEKINGGKRETDSYAKQTNLCVAYTKTGELDKATAACEAALAAVLDNRHSRRSYPGSSRAGSVDRFYLALALSNLGVLQAAKGSPDIARQTFREALELDTGLSAPKVNLDRAARGEIPNA
jgi:tetratricopeptide (TPR) repeat protein